jgi:hypothetical protein
LPAPKNRATSQGQPATAPVGPSSSGRPTIDDGPIIKPKKKDRSGADSPVRPRGLSPSLKDLIPIDAGTGSVAKPGGKTDPYAFYMEYYRTDDKDRTDPEKLRRIVRDLNHLGKFREVHAVFLGYLKNHPKLAEPWMYEGLAWAIELNHGSAADVKTALNYAADIAQRTHNPNHLVSAADKLLFKGYYERVGYLLDEAIPKVPHRSEPRMMSITLARKTKDPRRIADAIDGLLSLGWPGQDEYFRVEARKEAEALANILREENRGPEADVLLAKLTESG